MATKDSTSRNSSSKGVVPHDDCPLCNWWNAPKRSRGTEEFVYFAHYYVVDKAVRIIRKAPRELFDVEVDQLAGFVNYPAQPAIDILNTVRACIDERHVDHVNDDPIILAHVPRDRNDPSKPRPVLPIDGHHRIAKAIKNGIATLKAYVLTEAETDKIVVDVMRSGRWAR